MIAFSEAVQRAEKGLAFLLERGHQFGLRDVSTINLDTLDIESGYRCVLGQLNKNGHYTSASDRIRAVLDSPLAGNSMKDLGFSGSFDGGVVYGNCAVLTSAWIIVLSRHFEGAAA